MDETEVLRVKVYIPDLSYDMLCLSVGCRVCGRACTDESIQFQQDFYCTTCGQTRNADSKIYFRFRCTDGSATLTLDAYTKNAEKLLNVKSNHFYLMPLPDRRCIVDRAQIRYRIGTAELIISPVKNLLLNHRVIKWFLKDVIG